ncbi:MAG: alanine--tRNA ligase, partial [Candidatus Omnitrophica bacterium]|nr:alanine--tRNA ligase [Candidatus Omnitrophota bacterium]
MTADLLREKFLVFFKARGHKIVDSDSLVPKDDPTVLFTPAGMNQFKKEFMGFDSGFKRAATSQRCLRTDDLEKVGQTSCHHTFFEMLGNFSFGDYFKKEAISWAWEFLTKELSISPEKLRVSVYQDDDQAYNIWKDIVKVPEDRIVRLGDKDNFWPAEARTKGPNGPCGPCSEIFYDFGPEVGCGEKICDPSCSCGRFVEIWNLVFTQFNRKDDTSLEPLPNKNIDTGMGLERLTAVMQGKQNNFETELFQPIIKEIQRTLQVKPDLKVVYAVADHIRAVTFSIFDGIMPSNEGRGYVVRKVIRKAVLHLKGLGIAEPFLYKLVSIVAEIMRNPYPELISRREDIARVVLAEENNFIFVLSSSQDLFNDKFAEFIKKPDPEKVGNIAFLLHDTYGIPLELTKEWLDQQKISFSEEVFQQAMRDQKTRSKAGSVMKG